MTLHQKLHELRNQRKAILAANFYNLETLQGILRAAAEVNEPVILQLSRSSLNYMGIAMAAIMARKAFLDYGVEGWIHLDHGDSFDLVKECLEAGFDSVMIDASEKEFEKNAELTASVVQLARKYGANVEAELGYVAKLGQEQSEKIFTQPEEALKFTTVTGVDALAVAIGSAHGFYREAPVLQIELLSRIHQVVPVPLVLHGSSGIPNEMLAEAVKNGICKINLATEIKDTFMKKLKSILLTTDEIDLRKVFPPATNAVTELIKSKLLFLKNI